MEQAANKVAASERATTENSTKVLAKILRAATGNKSQRSNKQLDSRKNGGKRMDRTTKNGQAPNNCTEHSEENKNGRRRTARAVSTQAFVRKHGSGEKKIRQLCKLSMGKRGRGYCSLKRAWISHSGSSPHPLLATLQNNSE